MKAKKLIEGRLYRSLKTNAIVYNDGGSSIIEDCYAGEVIDKGSDPWWHNGAHIFFQSKNFVLISNLDLFFLKINLIKNIFFIELDMIKYNIKLLSIIYIGKEMKKKSRDYIKSLRK
jgi:hypothetical protein